MYEADDVPMSERNYEEPLLEVAVCLLGNSIPLPIDMASLLLGDGIDVETLTELYGE